MQIFDLKMDPFVKAKIVYKLLLFRGRSAGKKHYLLQILKINIFGNFYLNKATTISIFSLSVKNQGHKCNYIPFIS